MSSLQLTRFEYDPNKMSLVEGHAGEEALYGLAPFHRILMLSSPSADLYRTECMLRGIDIDLTTVEPGERVFIGNCLILHFTNEYPDYRDDGDVWINKT